MKKTSLYNRFTKQNFLVTFNIAFLLFLFALILLNPGSFKITGLAILGSYSDVIYINNNFELQEIEFIIPIENKKDADIIVAYANIQIFDHKNQEVSNITTNSIKISQNNRSELKARLSGLSSGNYNARVLVFLDNENYGFSKIFEIEKKTLTFESIVVNDFKLGSLTTLDIVLENHLNDSINALASMRILSLEGEDITELRSNPENIPANTIKKINLSWDTKNIGTGKYNAKLIVNYGEKYIERELVFNVYEDALEVAGVGYAVSSSNSSSGPTIYLVVFLVILLVIVNIMWMIIYNKKKKNKDKNK
ncbi:MAG: hypothetical protein ACP5OG_01195 [Candidatus Nanoarchaeia archaeon]